MTESILVTVASAMVGSEVVEQLSAKVLLTPFQSSMVDPTSNLVGEAKTLRLKYTFTHHVDR
jgi:hypothetical protein